MKIIIKNHLIETGLITHVERLDQTDGSWEWIQVCIYFLATEYPLKLIVGEYIRDSDPDYQASKVLNSELANQMIDFINQHSDSPTVPIPIFQSKLS